METVNDVESCYKPKTDPHQPIREEPLTGHSSRELDNRVRQFLIFRPRFPNDDSDANHNKQHGKEKGGPIQHRRQPAQQIRLCVERSISLVVPR